MFEDIRTSFRRISRTARGACHHRRLASSLRHTGPEPLRPAIPAALAPGLSNMPPPQAHPPDYTLHPLQPRMEARLHLFNLSNIHIKCGGLLSCKVLIGIGRSCLMRTSKAYIFYDDHDTEKQNVLLKDSI